MAERSGPVSLRVPRARLVSRDGAERAGAALLAEQPGIRAERAAGEALRTFYQFPASQHRSLRTANAIERMQQEFRRRVKIQVALPSEGAVLRLFFELWVSEQINLRRLRGYRDLGGQEKAAEKKRFS